MDLNVIIRGQSNALLFADRGGAGALERGLEARLGVDVHLISEWGTDSSTIHSATAFLDWDTDGQQQSLLQALRELPADLRDNPTATVWMHNEYDQKNSFGADEWVREVRADADLVRDTLGQDAGTTPYTFVPIRYPYGGNFGAIGDGMAQLDADGSFNAEISWAGQGLTMDGDGFPDSSHMGDGDAVRLGESLAESMANTLRPLANGGGGGAAPPPVAEPEPPAAEPEPPAAEPEPPVAQPPVAQPPVAEPNEPGTATAGEGADMLVLKISQDAYMGDARYTVSVDGQQVGDTFTAASEHGAGASDTLTLKGDWGAGTHAIAVTFLNDEWDGTPDTDRNLHVDGGAYNGAAIAGCEATLWSAGTVDLDFTGGGAASPPQPAPSAPAEPEMPEPSAPPSAAPEAVDWDAIAAQVLANYEATGSWYM